MQDITTISELNIENTCRTCLFQSNELNSLFDAVGTSELSLAEVLMAFAQVQIIQNDGLPSRICNECTNQTINAYNFKIKAEEHEKFLLNYINEKKIKNVEEVLSNSADNENDLVITIKVEAERILEEDMVLKKNAITKEQEQQEDEHQYKNESDIDNIPVETFHSESETELLPTTSEGDDFHCELCGTSYAEKKLLSNHLKTHGRENTKKCEVCNKNFTSDDQLKTHMEQHAKAKFFDCSECTEKFESKLRLKMHRSTVHANKKRRKQVGNDNKKSLETDLKVEFIQELDTSPNGRKTVQCKICRAQFNKISFLRDHLETHKSFENCNLDHCEFIRSDIPKSESELNDLIAEVVEHLKQGRLSRFYSIINQSGMELRLSDSETESDSDEFGCNRRRLYVCEICNKIFDRKYKALYHQKSSHSYEELIHKCSYCTKRFISEELLKGHLKSQCENMEKLFICEECNTKFMWHENLILHSNIQHSTSAKKVKKKDVPREKSFSCKICDKSFYRQEHLDRHANIHQPDEKKFECPTCHKKFNRKDNMKSHMKIHREDRDKDDTDKHLCVYCGRSFSNSSNLIVHMRRHTGEKPYKCDLCDKGFPRSSDLQCHRRTHTGEKPCLCTICGKGFSRSNKLARHMRIHTGVRPYKCSYCDRAFTQSNDLTLHIRRHTGDKPYVCGICGERFIQGTALHTHRRLKGHFEEGAQEAPYSSISVNNPNRTNFANRVDRIGIAKDSSSQGPVEIKPVGRGNSRNFLKSNCKTVEEEAQSISIVNCTSDGILSTTDERDLISTNQCVKNISSFIQPSSVPINSNSAFLNTANVPFVQLEDGDFFGMTNLGYQTYH